MAGSALAWVAVVALVVSLIALVVALAAGRRPRRSSAQSDVLTAVRQGDLTGAIEQTAARIAELEDSHKQASEALRRLTGAQRLAISHAGVVRFDALNEQTGELSFAVALLDSAKNGVVLTSINGRHQTRIYAKAIDVGRSTVALSDEERDAIERAMEPHKEPGA